MVLAALVPLLSTALFAAELDREAFRRKIRERNADFLACYQEGLKLNPKLEGKIVLDWNVDDNGAVTRAAVKSSTVADDKIGPCMIEKLKTVKFPAPPKGSDANIEYPFVFSPSKK